MTGARHRLDLRLPGGVPLLIDPRVLLLPVLATASLWWGWRGNGPAVAAIVVPGLVLSILVHELGHALTARRLGGRVLRIELDADGGSVLIEGEEDRARDAITWAGPLANLALGGALLLAAWLLSATWPAAPVHEASPHAAFSQRPPGPTGTGRRALLWLGWGNLLLGFGNLLPGYPLDGGVLLHRAVERRFGRRRALRTVGGLGMATSVLTWAAFAISLAAGVPLLLPPEWRPNRDAWRAAGSAQPTGAFPGPSLPGDRERGGRGTAGIGPPPPGDGDSRG